MRHLEMVVRDVVVADHGQAVSADRDRGAPADASGDYSAYADGGTGKDEAAGTTFLRGRQTADTEGIVEFATIYPGWEDSERLGFTYYPIPGIEIKELHLAPDNVTATNDILLDPRGMWMAVLWADSFAILEAAGRERIPIRHFGEEYTQLPFEPYRLIHIAPISGTP